MLNVFLQFCNYLSFVKDRALHLNKLESPSSKDDLVQVLLKLAPVVLEKMKMWKVDDNDDNDNNDNDGDGQRTNFDQISSLEPSAQVT